MACQPDMIGFDMEWRVKFQTGVAPCDVALIQLCYELPAKHPRSAQTAQQPAPPAAHSAAVLSGVAGGVPALVAKHSDLQAELALPSLAVLQPLAQHCNAPQACQLAHSTHAPSTQQPDHSAQPRASSWPGSPQAALTGQLTHGKPAPQTHASHVTAASLCRHIVSQRDAAGSAGPVQPGETLPSSAARAPSSDGMPSSDRHAHFGIPGAASQAPQQGTYGRSMLQSAHAHRAQPPEPQAKKPCTRPAQVQSLAGTVHAVPRASAWLAGNSANCASQPSALRVPSHRQPETQAGQRCTSAQPRSLERSHPQPAQRSTPAAVGSSQELPRCRCLLIHLKRTGAGLSCVDSVAFRNATAW
jgi:hypothetical protein